MTMNPFDHTLRPFRAAAREGKLYSLTALGPEVARLPVSIRIVLESLVRNCDGERVRAEDVRALLSWKPRGARTEEVPFVVARVLLQDFTGVPLLVDLAAMRSAVARLGKDPRVVQPLVPVDLVIDHSVQVDYFARPDALDLNLKLEFQRNEPRYQFLKWGMGAFDGLRIVPPGIGICHQVNLEYLARGVLEKDGVFYPDTLVGTDSHTTMINGLGIVGWGVGGIEAEAGMLGQPVYFLQPDVVGVHMAGSLREGVTATDLVLHVTEMLRKAKVVGKFVEFHGEGAALLSAAERATVSNMCPEYGATIGFFPPDEETCRYLLQTGRPAEQVEALRNYFLAQGLFGMPGPGACDYTSVLTLDLSSVRPSVAGPKRPQDRIDLGDVKGRFRELLGAPAPAGYGRAEPRRVGTQVDSRPVEVGDGDVLIAAITSCTNTSNPGVMLTAGLVARHAVERGLTVPPTVKTSLAPGSRVVTEYLQKTGLQQYLDAIGFHTVGYGCTTCIGNSGPLDPRLEEAVTQNDLVGVSVLSGNRNFEARVHQNIKANFLMSPPLVVAFALAGRVDVDLEREPVATGKDGSPVYLRDLWPTPEELRRVSAEAVTPEDYRRLYADVATRNALWNRIPSPEGLLYRWDPASTYIREAPYFEGFAEAAAGTRPVRGGRALAVFGDSITTDHISPAGAFKPSSPAGQYLQANGVGPADFNSYGARRGNHEVMVRGTFANVRIKNLLVPGVEGGVTVHQPSGERMTVYEAALRYQKEGVPLLVIAGHEYGTGSSRDWAAKGPRLLGVAAVVARSFERIHRSNLVGMGVLPCQLPEDTNAERLGLDGTERYDIEGVGARPSPRQKAELVVHRRDGRTDRVPLTVRIDTPIEVEYYAAGGILPYVLGQILRARGS
jgi:aconitate hydratase